MKRVYSLVLLALVAFFAGCTNSDAIVKAQADAKAKAARWQAKADIEKWKAAKALAESGSDVGRAAAGFTLQADAIRTGGQGAASVAGGGYYVPPSPLETVISVSREARGWAGLAVSRDIALDNNRTQREMRANDNATFVEFGREIGSTGRYGIDATRSLGSAGIQKIGHVPAAPSAPADGVDAESEE